MKWVAYVLTLMQIFNTILINFHLFNPGWKKNLFMLILVALWFVAIEVFIYFASGKNFINISYLTIVLSGLTVIYSMFILFFGHNSYNNYLLPINLAKNLFSKKKFVLTVFTTSCACKNPQWIKIYNNQSFLNVLVSI